MKFEFCNQLSKYYSIELDETDTVGSLIKKLEDSSGSEVAKITFFRSQRGGISSLFFPQKLEIDKSSDKEENLFDLGKRTLECHLGFCSQSTFEADAPSKTYTQSLRL